MSKGNKAFRGQQERRSDEEGQLGAGHRQVGHPNQRLEALGNPGRWPNGIARESERYRSKPHHHTIAEDRHEDRCAEKSGERLSQEERQADRHTVLPQRARRSNVRVPEIEGERDRIHQRACFV